MIACENSGHSIPDDFPEVRKIVEAGGTTNPKKDYELDEDNRRLVVRGDIKQWNQMLAETAHNAGVITNEEFAIFQNAGYMGLYGGLDVDDIHTKKHYAGRFANTGKKYPADRKRTDAEIKK